MELYPSLKNSTLEDVVTLLKRIIKLRNDDVPEVDTLQDQAGYEKGFKRNTLATATSIPVGEHDLYIDVTTGADVITLTLLEPPLDGQTHWIYKADAGGGSVTIEPGALTINGSATLSLANQYDWTCLVYMGAAGEWRAAT